MPGSERPHGLQPTRLLGPWDFPGKSTGVGCHCLLWGRTESDTTEATWQQWIIEEAREFQKTVTFALLTTPKPLTVWITANCGKLRCPILNNLWAKKEIMIEIRKYLVRLYGKKYYNQDVLNVDKVRASEKLHP